MGFIKLVMKKCGMLLLFTKYLPLFRARKCFKKFLIILSKYIWVDNRNINEPNINLIIFRGRNKEK